MLHDLEPTLIAHELQLHASQYTWNYQLQSASKYVELLQRRRHRRHRERRNGKKRQLQLRYNNDDGYLDAEEVNKESSTTTSTCLSPLQKWFVSLIESIGIDTWDEINTYNITSLAYLYKHHVSSADGTNEYFGGVGERTEEMKKNHASLTTFWSSNTGDDTSSSSNVLLLGMHGTDLADNKKLIPTLQQMYNLDGNEAYSLASRIQSIIQTLPNTYNNPILTANAIAIQSRNPDGSKSEKDSIIIGDGVFSFLEWLGLENDGPKYIHAHEYGHHIQYDLGVKKIGNGWSKSQETRRWEIMADVFGSYYNAHANGGRMDSSKLLQVHRAAFSLGDCEDGRGTHHGTPRQRECASNFGTNLALSSYMDGGEYKIPPAELRHMFDIRYEKILALDDDQCEAVLDSSLLDKAIYGEVMDTATDVGSDSSTSSSTTSNWFEQQQQQHQDIETPTWGDSAPIEYEPYNGFFADQEEDYWWNNNGGGGTTFGVYNPTDDALLQTTNELDEPPPRIQNDENENGEDFDIDEEWFGTSQSRWVGGNARSSAGSCSGIGWTVMLAITLLRIASLY